MASTGVALVAGLCTSSSAPFPFQPKPCLSHRNRLQLREKISHCFYGTCKTDHIASLVLNPRHRNRILESASGSTAASKVQQISEARDMSNYHLEESASALSDDLQTMKEDLTPTMGLVNTYLESTLEHRLWVAFGTMEATAMVTKALFACHFVTARFLQVTSGAVLGYVLADLVSGVLHWGVDNYGDANTPVFGPVIDAFQGHHQRPWTITKRQFANNAHVIAKFSGLSLLPFLILPSNQLFLNSLVGFFLGFVIMSQQFHAWAHMKKSQLPDFVVALQNVAILVSRKMHGAHHKPPYDINYCIVSGIWNAVLEHQQICKHLERFICTKWGVAPRAWSETSQEWLQEGTYFEEGTDTDDSFEKNETILHILGTAIILK